jgi:hypothetical protein
MFESISLVLALSVRPSQPSPGPETFPPRGCHLRRPPVHRPASSLRRSSPSQGSVIRMPDGLGHIFRRGLLQRLELPSQLQGESFLSILSPLPSRIRSPVDRHRFPAEQPIGDGTVVIRRFLLFHPPLSHSLGESGGNTRYVDD